MERTDAPRKEQPKEEMLVSDPEPLYAMMNYSDNKTVTIIGFYPIDLNGHPDVERDTQFRGQVNLLQVVNGQPTMVPFNFDFPPEVVELKQAFMQWKSILTAKIAELEDKIKAQRIRQTLLTASGRQQ